VLVNRIPLPIPFWNILINSDGFPKPPISSIQEIVMEFTVIHASLESFGTFLGATVSKARDLDTGIPHSRTVVGA
jgi:hypothetical protein